MIFLFKKNYWKYLIQGLKLKESKIKTILCRIKGHPCGVIWYNPNGIEPDMHCKNCGDDLG